MTDTQELVKRLPKDFRVYSPSEQAWYDDLPQAIRDTIERLQRRIAALTELVEAMSREAHASLKRSTEQHARIQHWADKLNAAIAAARSEGEQK